MGWTGRNDWWKCLLCLIGDWDRDEAVFVAGAGDVQVKSEWSVWSLDEQYLVPCYYRCELRR